MKLEPASTTRRSFADLNLTEVPATPVIVPKFVTVAAPPGPAYTPIEPDICALGAFMAPLVRVLEPARNKPAASVIE